MLIRLIEVSLRQTAHMSNRRLVSIDDQLSHVILVRHKFLLGVANNHDLADVVIDGEVHRGLLLAVLDAYRGSILNQELANLSFP